MPQLLLTVGPAAERAGMNITTFRRRVGYPPKTGGNDRVWVPAPDFTTGDGAGARMLWLPETIDAWVREFDPATGLRR